MVETDNTTDSAELKSLILKRGQIKAKITRFKTFIDSITEDSNFTELKKRIEKLDLIFNEFENIQTQIEEHDSSERQETERDSFESLYYEVAAKGEDLVHTYTPVRSSSSTSSSTSNQCSTSNAPQIKVKLPSIDLPSFNGRYEDWLSFSETFQALIHKNEALSDVQRLHYLKSSLKGDASQVLQSLELIASNYTVAWSLLEDRFKNEKIIIQKHVQSLFDLPSVDKDTNFGLRQLLDGAMKHIRALKALNQPTDSWDTLLVHVITRKLSTALQREWELSSRPDKMATFNELCEFLQRRCQVLENASINRLPQKPQSTHSKPTKSVKTFSIVQTENNSCRICKGSHQTFQCRELAVMSEEDRTQRLKTAGLCFNCLKPGHQAKRCFSTGCKICHKKHNTTLHPKHQVSNKQESSQSQPTEKTNNTVNVHTATDVLTDLPSSEVILSTAIVEVVGPTGKIMTCRALLDNGSQSCFATERVCQQLGLSKSRNDQQIVGLSNSQVNSKGKTTALVRSRVTDYQVNLNFIIVSKITGDLPRERVNLRQINIPKHVTLADPTFQSPGPIDILIGQEIFYDILCIGQIKQRNSPTLQKTRLGWVVGGKISNNSSKNEATCLFTSTVQVNSQLEKFWILEEVTNKIPHTSEEKGCEELYCNTTKRGEDGRYTVTMPLKMEPCELGDSRTVAEKRFMQVERKLLRSPDLHRQYCEFMREYERLNHMEKIEEEEECNAPEYFLPHHAVIKSSSTTTRLRVVFDASAKTTSDLSLNDIQMVGPTVQSDIFSIFLRFRIHNVVLTADVEKMYRQVNIDASQQNLLKIFWRESPDQEINTFKLKTVTYGTASAPYLATRTLLQLAEDEKHQFSMASEVAKTDFYVDDLLTGTQTEEGARAMQSELTCLLSKGGFNLRKWSSNSSTLRKEFLCEEQSEHSQSEEFSSDGGHEVKTLGLWWDAHKDQFNLRPNQEYSINKNHVTKRTILSNIARIFDPLGLVGPVVVRAKMQLQALWKLNLSWDESLPMSLFTDWIKLSHCLNDLNNIYIPRQATISQSSLPYDLHGFSDASERAYGAAVYLRHEDERGNVQVNLLCAKSRVAPLKTVSLPRLELCAALLLSELMHTVSQALHVNSNHSNYWSDSTVTLAWLQSEPSRWTTFVANRVSKIQDLTQDGSWRHIKSEENPADLLSRGAQAQCLINSHLWWNGPSWLTRHRDHWPIKENEPNIDLPEQRRQAVVLTTTTPDINDTFTNLLQTYSSFGKLVRILAHCLRFITNLKKNSTKKSGPLEVEEVEDAKLKIIKQVQGQAFSSELRSLRSNHPVKSRELQQLALFIDGVGIIRVGGRLEESAVQFSQRHPILLPKNHKITELIVHEIHIKNLHCGPQALLYAVRQQYWPISGRNLTRKITLHCLRCFRARPKTAHQLMGNLPSSRVNPARCFLHTGVDYCGPFYIKQSRRRGSQTTKAYVCVFVCLASKAVHLELVSDMTTDSFLGALRRFTSRRGVCSMIYSDNGRNFIGANRELKAFRRFLESEASTITDATTKEGIRWKFNPPYSAHMGGLWEAAVKSLKTHFRRTVGNASLTFEEFTTVLTQVEAVLNSRPLTPLSSDPSDLAALTPGHFLTGGSLTAIPEPSLTPLPESRLSRWQRVQQILQHFWKRWSREYLSTLQQRGKWSTVTPPIQPGDLVLLRDDNLPPLSWPMGRVTQTHPGKDHHVRVVSVRTATGVVTRAINKLCPLPKDES